MAEPDAEVDAGEAVKVFIRIRPLNRRELEEKQILSWAFNETSMIEDTQNGQRVYQYDHCFGPTGTNKETYEIVGKPIVLKAMDGYNGTVFTCKFTCTRYILVLFELLYILRWSNRIRKNMDNER